MMMDDYGDGFLTCYREMGEQKKVLFSQFPSSSSAIQKKKTSTLPMWNPTNTANNVKCIYLFIFCFGDMFMFMSYWIPEKMMNVF
jgi:hypothetical protein